MVLGRRQTDSILSRRNQGRAVHRRTARLQESPDSSKVEGARIVTTTPSRLIAEAESVAWIERTKGGARAAAIIEQLVAELRRVRDAEERRLAAVVDAIRDRGRELG